MPRVYSNSRGKTKTASDAKQPPKVSTKKKTLSTTTVATRKRKSEADSSVSGQWTDAQLTLLRTAVALTRPNTADYWQVVARHFNGDKTAEQCQLQYQNSFKSPKRSTSTRRRTAAASEPKAEPLLAETRGKLTKKRKLRQLLKQADAEHRDDVFESTPFKSRVNQSQDFDKENDCSAVGCEAKQSLLKKHQKSGSVFSLTASDLSFLDTEVDRASNGKKAKLNQSTDKQSVIVTPYKKGNTAEAVDDDLDFSDDELPEMSSHVLRPITSFDAIDTYINRFKKLNQNYRRRTARNDSESDSNNSSNDDETDDNEEAESGRRPPRTRFRQRKPVKSKKSKSKKTKSNQPIKQSTESVPTSDNPTDTQITDTLIAEVLHGEKSARDVAIELHSSDDDDATATDASCSEDEHFHF